MPGADEEALTPDVRIVKERDNTAFWTIAIGVPVLLSVLRLWIEAGGELQTTLLLVAHIDPINLVAALVATASWLVAGILVAALAVGGVLNASGPAGQSNWLARWTAQAPQWVRLGSFAMAAVTWQIIYLPLLFVAACAAFQLSPWMAGRPWRGTLTALFGLSVYGAVVAETLVAAWRLEADQRAMAVTLLTAPPVLALFIAGPLRPWLVRPFAVIAPMVAAALTLWAAVPLVTTPVLPLTVTVISAEQFGEPSEYLRGHVITSDNVNTIVLAEDGRVSYVPNERIEAQYLCRTSEEIPRYRLRLRLLGEDVVLLEHSVLRGLGQANRGSAPVSPACRVPAR